jgi:hypothetical protein
MAIWQTARSGNLKAIKIVKDLLESRRKLLGIDEAIKHALFGADGGPIEIKTWVDLVKAAEEHECKKHKK